MELSEKSGLKQKTVENIVTDLMRFGIAAGTCESIRLDPGMREPGPDQILRRIRAKLETRALRQKLLRSEMRSEKGVPVTIDKMARLLKKINPAANHETSSLRSRCLQIARWFSATGLLFPVSDNPLSSAIFISVRRFGK